MVGIFDALFRGCQQPVVDRSFSPAISPPSSPRFLAVPAGKQEKQKPIQDLQLQDRDTTTVAIFDRLLKHADIQETGILQEEELARLLPLLRSQGSSGISLAFVLEWADLGSFGRAEWIQHMRSLEYPEATLQGFLTALDELDAIAGQQRPAKPTRKAPNGPTTDLADGSRERMDSSPAQQLHQRPVLQGLEAMHLQARSLDGQVDPNLPPGFKMVESDSEPGKMRYYDPVAHVKYTTVEHAWQAYETRRKNIRPAQSALLARVRCDFSDGLAAAEAARAVAEAQRRCRSSSSTAPSTSAPEEVPMPGADGRFLDTDFPPARASLGVPRPGRSFIDETKVASTKWIRLPTLIRMNSGLPESQPILLWDRISPQDLIQGQIGNCWLIATIAALAEFPAAIQRLFVKADVEIGRYVVWLYDMSKAEWEEVTIDDYIPCHYESDWSGVPCRQDEFGQKIYRYEDTHNHDGTSRIPKKWIPHFARPTANTMWAPLLEKAMAKFVGSYAWLAGGSEPYALTAFTGMPLVYCFVRPSADCEDTSAQLGSWEWNGAQYISRDRTGMNYTPISAEKPIVIDDEMWQRLLQYDARNYVMTASITKFVRPDTLRGFFRKDGLVLGHAYSLISCQAVNVNPSSTSPSNVQWVDDDGDHVGFECSGGQTYAICNGERYQPNGEAHIVQLVVSEREGKFTATDSAGAAFSNRCPAERCPELQLLWATRTSQSDQTLRLVMLRNPHGEGNASEGSSTEWSGTWCNGCRLWDVLPEVAQQVNYDPTMRDGMFWMSWEDFRGSFDKVCILAKSMAEPRAASAFERRAERNREISMGLAQMVSKMADAGLVKDLRQVSMLFDPFCMLPSFLDDGSLETRLRWEASKPGRLQMYLDLSKERGNEANYNYFLKLIHDLGLEHALTPSVGVREHTGDGPGKA